MRPTNMTKRQTGSRNHARRVVDSLGYTKEGIVTLMGNAKLVIKTWLEWGPCDDGSPQGNAFEAALDDLFHQLNRMGLIGGEID